MSIKELHKNIKDTKTIITYLINVTWSIYQLNIFNTLDPIVILKIPIPTIDDNTVFKFEINDDVFLHK